MYEKHLWKSDILSKDAGQWVASLLKMSLFHSSTLFFLLGIKFCFTYCESDLKHGEVAKYYGQDCGKLVTKIV